jgi:hypothetical protein
MWLWKAKSIECETNFIATSRRTRAGLNPACGVEARNPKGEVPNREPLSLCIIIKISEAGRDVNVKFLSRQFIGRDIGIGVIIWDFRLRPALVRLDGLMLLTLRLIIMMQG